MQAFTLPTETSIRQNPKGHDRRAGWRRGRARRKLNGMRRMPGVTHAQQIAADRQEIGKLEGVRATESTHLVES